MIHYFFFSKLTFRDFNFFTIIFSQDFVFIFFSDSLLDCFATRDFRKSLKYNAYSQQTLFITNLSFDAAMGRQELKRPFSAQTYNNIGIL